MRNYLHRLIERATGDRAAAPQHALQPQVGPRHETDDAGLEGAALLDAKRPTAAEPRSETPLTPLSPPADVRDPFATPPLTQALPPPHVAPSTLGSSPSRAERTTVIEKATSRTDDGGRLAPSVPRSDEHARRSEPPLAPTTPRAEPHDSLAAPTPLAPPPRAPPPLAPPPPARLIATITPLAPVPPISRLAPPQPTPGAPAPLHAPSTLQPPATPDRPPLPPPPPILSIGRVVVEVLPAPTAPRAPTPIVVQRTAPPPGPAQSSILHRGFGLGQS